MLTITVAGVESFDDKAQEFSVEGGTVLELEHSLVSLSKWESEYEKPFLGKDEKSSEEIVGYVKAMVVTPNIPPELFSQLSQENFNEINNYLDSKRSATWFADAPGAPKTRDVVTSELIYYWMTIFQIPFTCETWHLNRLFTLIRICNLKQAKPKKMSRAEIAARNRDLNAKRRQQMNSTG